VASKRDDTSSRLPWDGPSPTGAHALPRARRRRHRARIPAAPAPTPSSRAEAGSGTGVASGPEGVTWTVPEPLTPVGQKLYVAMMSNGALGGLRSGSASVLLILSWKVAPGSVSSTSNATPAPTYQRATTGCVPGPDV